VVKDLRDEELIALPVGYDYLGSAETEEDSQ
jgi:hypothetical protein